MRSVHRDYSSIKPTNSSKRKIGYNYHAMTTSHNAMHPTRRFINLSETSKSRSRRTGQLANRVMISEWMHVYYVHRHIAYPGLRLPTVNRLNKSR